MNLIVYAGHDNHSDIDVFVDGAAIDLTITTGNRIEFELGQKVGGATKTINMVTDPTLFTVHPSSVTGRVRVQLGSKFTDADVGAWEARLVLYDATHINGERHGDPMTITVKK